VQLEVRLDSLQQAFEEMGLDAPDRVDLVRQLHVIIASLSDLSEIEQHVRANVSSPVAMMRAKRQLVGGSEMVAGLFRTPITLLHPGWIGINAEAPHERIVRDDSAFIRYFTYPEIVSVEPNSPAERVGIARGDQLIAYDGADVRDREINLTRLLQPSRRITVTVRRDGAERQFPVIVVRPPARIIERLELSVPDGLPDSLPARVLMLHEAPRAGRILEFDRMDASSAPVAGAKLAEIRSEDLGHVFGVSRGVLVTDVFSDPAREAGLHGGDVIVRADGRDLTSVAQLRRIVAAHGGDRAVELEIVRQKKTRSLTLRW
jgi:serine protease Do